MKTIVTLTTVPTRLNYSLDQGIRLCINSLLNQTYENYEIHFNIPYINVSTNTEYIVPDELLNEPKIKIFRTDDFGPATKLIPTVERISEDDTIIIVVDDDLVYHSEMVAAHVHNQQIWPEAVVGYDGMRSRDEHGNFSSHFGDVRDYYFTSNYRSSRVDILQHYKSVSYKRYYFENDFFDFVKENYSWADDLMMAAYFSHKKRDRIATFHESDENFSTQEEWSTRGGVESFPVIRHTHHEYLEGCNVFRSQEINDNNGTLFKFIDYGYVK